MEFRDLKRQYQIHKEEIDSAIKNTMETGIFIGGSAVLSLERKLEEYVGVKHCITCGNGTDALQLALMAWNIGPGDAVFVPDFTFFSSGEVVPVVGATPVFVDIEKKTFNICVESLKNAIEYVIQNTNLKPRVIVAVDLFGQPANFDAIQKIANQYGLLILEDAAQGFGGTIGNKKACSFGDISTTSFFPAKPLGCYGDGGAIFTDNDEWAEIIQSLKVHGKGIDKYDNIRIGTNSRLDAIQAAVLLEKLKFFDEEIQRCQYVAECYTRNLKDIVETPVILEGNSSSWAQYTILLRNDEKRIELIDYLNRKNIPAFIYYHKPMSMQRAFEKYKIYRLECLNAKIICNRCLSLPMHAYMSEKEINSVCMNIREFLKG